MNYFVESNGAAGYVDFIDSNFKHLKKWIHLYDYPRSFAVKLIDKIALLAKNDGKDFDMIYNSIDNLPEGLIMEDKGVLAVPFNRKNGFSLGNLMDTGDYKLFMEQAYSCFSKAKSIHDDWEQVYIQNINFESLNALTEKTMQKLIGDRSLPKTGFRQDRFFGAATIYGSKDYINNLTDSVKKRYLIKGRPGTGKSTFLRKIAEYALSHGFDAEIYHCAFDAQSLDMVILRELEICLFDSTAPHEYFPSGERDEIIDIYKIAVMPGTDEKYSEVLSEISASYKQAMDKARGYIIRAKACLDEAESKMLVLLDSDKIKKVNQTVINEFFETE